MSTSQYILDFILNEGKLNQKVASLDQGIWVTFKADGNDCQLASPCVKSSRTPKWDFCARVILTLPDLNSAFLFVNLSTLDKCPKQPRAIGHAKIGLKGFPVGRPGRFTFSLMSVENNAVSLGQLTLTATISAVVGYHSSPTQRPPAPYPMNVQGFASGVRRPIMPSSF